MNLREVTEEIGKVIGPELAAGFTGRLSFDIDLRQGGIAKVSVRKEHDLRARTAGSAQLLNEGKQAGAMRPFTVPGYREDRNGMGG